MYTDAAPPTNCERAEWVHDRPEIWAVVAMHLGLVGAWRLMLVCQAARVGATYFLSTLPGIVVSGGDTAGGRSVSEVWRLDLATLRWNTMLNLGTARSRHVCCAVRGALVVIGGINREALSSVEIIRNGDLGFRGPGSGFTELPPLSCGEIFSGAAVAVDESVSAAGQVLLLGGDICPDSSEESYDDSSDDSYGDDGADDDADGSDDDGGHGFSTAHLVDLATGVCQPQAGLLSRRDDFAAAQLPDGRIAYAGGGGWYGVPLATSEVWEPLGQGAVTWSRRELPEMSVERWAGRACALSDGRFAVIGGVSGGHAGATLSSCEALKIGADENWELLPSMHDARYSFACVAVAGCVVVAGGNGRREWEGKLKTAEVFDEGQGRWFRLPRDLPHDGGLSNMGCALL
jgi:hypothetical protein